MGFSRDRDAAPRKAAGFEAAGQQPGPCEDTASPLTPSDRTSLEHLIRPVSEGGVGWSTDRPLGAKVQSMLDTGEATDASLIQVAREMWVRRP